MKMRWNSSNLGNLHHLDHLLRQAARILLLHQLRKHAFEIGKAHELREVRRPSVSQDVSFGDDNDAVANLLDHLKHVGDVDDRFAFSGEQFKKVFEQAAGNDIEAGKRFVE